MTRLARARAQRARGRCALSRRTWRWRPVARGPARLQEKAHVVTARPVLGDGAVGDPPEVDEGPRHRLTGCLGAAEQWHGRCAVGAVQGEVLGYQVALADEVVLLERDRTEVDVDGVQDVPKALATLGAGGVVDELGRD